MKMTLKACRVNKGLTQEAAAKMLDISESALSLYERGLSYPSVPLIKKMEALYEVSYDDIKFLSN